MPERSEFKLLTDAQAGQDALEAEARRFAEERHAEQRYGRHPYGEHLAQVRGGARGLGYGGALAVAAWLHDTVRTPARRASRSPLVSGRRWRRSCGR